MTMAAPRCYARLSTQLHALHAVREVCEGAAKSLGAPADLAFLFLSAQQADAVEALAAEAMDRLPARCLLGCTAESIAGPATEVEQQPALAVWAARLPETAVVPMHLEFQRTPEGASFVGWPDEIPAEWPRDAALLALGDPFSFPADLLLERLHEDQPGSVIVGGMASAARQPGGNRLLVNRTVHRRGAAAVYLHGRTRLRTVVSQGCRPIGDPFVITRAQENVVYQLGGLPAYERLKEVYATLASREREMMRHGLHLGRVVNAYQDHFGQGDFLVRNVTGIDAEQGAIAVGDHLRAGQTVQFHIRDAETADAELRQLLARARDDHGPRPQGALLFSCNGRGTRLFPQPHHDVAAIEQAFGAIPVAGFFAAGELGPIGGKSFLHGFTASIALLA